MTPSSLHPYQQKAIKHLLHQPQAMLWLDMGLGKTAITLTAVLERLQTLESYGVLVVAPLRVIQSVWRQEAMKWSHLRELRFSTITGTRDERTRAAMVPSDVWLINYENLRWLADLWTQHYLSRGKYLPVNMLVLDEVTKVKNSTAHRHDALRRLLPFIPLRVGLTGTPASNGYLDLFGQYLAIDSGARLGQTKTEFKSRFFRPENPMSPFGRQVLTPGSDAVIESLVGDITLQMSNADYLQLPPVVPNVIELQLPPKRRAQYEKLERDMFVELDSGTDVESFNAASLTNRCLQFAQGAMYIAPGNPRWEALHDVKLDALDDVVEEAAGKPVLIAIEFRHDAERILKRYPDMRWVDASMSAARFTESLDLWQQGRLPGIIANPKSMAHGIDRLKDGPVDDLVWYGHTWSLDDYEQTIARLQRQGRTRPIRMHHLHMLDTVETAQRLALEDKAVTQDGLKAALNEYRRSKAA